MLAINCIVLIKLITQLYSKMNLRQILMSRDMISSSVTDKYCMNLTKLIKKYSSNFFFTMCLLYFYSLNYDCNNSLVCMYAKVKYKFLIFSGGRFAKTL